MKEAIVGFVILIFMIPFIYIFVADIVDVYKRLAGLFSHKVKPALIVISKTFMD